MLLDENNYKEQIRDCHISPNMACFCKLMAQNWHKNLPLAGLISGVTFIH